MGKVDTTNSADAERIRREWIERLVDLNDAVRQWAGELGWSTKPLVKTMQDSVVGEYKAPSLLIQIDTVRILLEPIARSAPGADGVVDLYLMPAYDDIASLYFCDGQWQLHYIFKGQPSSATTREAPAQQLTRGVFERVLAEMKANAE